jgi:hypothetical protein
MAVKHPLTKGSQDLLGADFFRSKFYFDTALNLIRQDNKKRLFVPGKSLSSNSLFLLLHYFFKLSFFFRVLFVSTWFFI